ncbi:hypothetical protein Rhom172_1513 [Rhodothermus marinus SG0.5JP17-172]|jgi:hypothetical protein|uniref:hypothetical protein n=1 Tax=Rhodothermus marinus TaxID=29549 RepID=UPI000223D8DA|nr:hypothetical protein [Rhodothermus marinus]AEN73433.1 hypothetical protein Rhom172_1513 [Rhodothermus marinus SG0.5JP17-172]MBO2491270.1 hypothetical protein [Rhodothermus marinus]
MKRLRHIGVLRGVSLGLALALLVGAVRPLWPVSGASYAAWLRVRLHGVLSASVLEEGLQEALADRPASLEAFVRAFLQACMQQEGGAAIRAALGLPAEASDDAVLAWLLGLVPRLVAEPILTPLLQASGGALLASLQRMASAALAVHPDAKKRLPSLALPITRDVPVAVPETLLFGAVLPMGP